MLESFVNCKWNWYDLHHENDKSQWIWIDVESYKVNYGGNQKYKAKSYFKQKTICVRLFVIELNLWVTGEESNQKHNNLQYKNQNFNLYLSHSVKIAKVARLNWIKFGGDHLVEELVIDGGFRWKVDGLVVEKGVEKDRRVGEQLVRLGVTVLHNYHMDYVILKVERRG